MSMLCAFMVAFALLLAAEAARGTAEASLGSWSGGQLSSGDPGDPIWACEDYCRESATQACSPRTNCTHQFGWVCRRWRTFSSSICIEGSLFATCTNPTIGSPNDPEDPEACAVELEDSHCDINDSSAFWDCKTPIDTCGRRMACTGS